MSDNCNIEMLMVKNGFIPKSSELENGAIRYSMRINIGTNKSPEYETLEIIISSKYLILCYRGKKKMGTSHFTYAQLCKNIKNFLGVDSQCLKY